MKKMIFGIIIGILATSVVGVTALVIYNANEIKYNPSDSNWNVDNVKSALDDLYNNTTCITGTYDHLANTNWNIEVGFIPSRVVLNFIHSSAKVYISYDKEISQKVMLMSFSRTNETSYNVEDFSDKITVSSTITSHLTSSYKSYTSAYTLYYVACK